MMTSICNEYWQFFLAQGIVTGAGLSLMYFAPFFAILKIAFKQRSYV
jgi:hypothetical protein